MAETLLARVRVNNGPLPGEGSRASGNFDISIPPSCSQLRFVTVPEATNVIFDLAQDWPSAHDPTLHAGLTSGVTVGLNAGQAVPPYNSVYFCEVKNASQPFEIDVYSA